MTRGGTPLPLFYVSIHSKELSWTPPPSIQTTRLQQPVHDEASTEHSQEWLYYRQ